MEPSQYFSVSNQNPWLFSYPFHNLDHNHHERVSFLAAFADCAVAAARAENGLCFPPLACFLGTPVGFTEVGVLPLPHDTPSPGAVPAGGYHSTTTLTYTLLLLFCSFLCLLNQS